MSETKIITIAELLAWLHVDFEFIKQMRRGRDGTHFPPPLLGSHGLAWYEQDVCDWLAYWADRRDWAADGLDPAELTPPVYLAAEPQAQVTKK
ncbi:MAG: hypothetical protein IT424_03920 [Pirellulales bacterium]|nr:hypothetical protein [Pirellulales bacterium]